MMQRRYKRRKCHGNQSKEREGRKSGNENTHQKKERTGFGRLNLTQTRPAQSGSKIRSSYCAFIIQADRFRTRLVNHVLKSRRRGAHTRCVPPPARETHSGRLLMHGTPEQSSYLVIDQWIGINLAPVFTDLVVAFSDNVHPDLEQWGKLRIPARISP